VNGKLTSELVPIGHGGRLCREAARAWGALYVAGMADGVGPFTWTPGGAYRTYAQQETGFYARWTTTPPPPDKPAHFTTFYLGQTWFLKPGNARSAVPGTSNHGLGFAVDIALGDDPSQATSITPAIPWLLRNAESLGWAWSLQSEPWHIQYVTGDTIPQRVLDIERWLAAQ
jgi:LAS superfamily LD-carboxypeptidase LdcB